MKKIDLLILSWHQTYLSKNAGGYVRLREFLKRIPKKVKFILLDNKPTIYKDAVGELNLVQYQTPQTIKFLEKNLFLVWFFLENIFAAFILYRNGRQIIKKYKPQVLYVPIGEFIHTYMPAILLKKRFPDLKLVIDILNFEIPEESIGKYYKRLRVNGTSILRSIFTIYATVQSSYLIRRTIKFADYVFTVSPDLVYKLKKVYKKNTIDFTASGVNMPFRAKKIDKKYLSIYIGRITVQKGVFEILEVWRKVVDKIPTAKLALAGQADIENLNAVKKRIDELSLDKNVFVMGKVSENEKNKILAESELFLHLASYEPLFPVIGILEGFSHGLPAIVYNMEVVEAEIKSIKDGKFIYVIQNSNIENVKEKIIDFSHLTNDEKLHLSNLARDYAKLFDWDKIAARELNIISGFLK